MADELTRKEDSTEVQSDERTIDHVEDTEQSTATGDRLTELESLVAEKEKELVRVNTRLTELEQLITDRDDEIKVLKEKEVELGERLTSTGRTLAEAVAGYKNIIVQANPEVPEELIGGDNMESIDNSLEKAKVLVNKVRQGLEAETMLNRIPAGAPERTAPDFTGLSPREKIQQAIGTKR